MEEERPNIRKIRTTPLENIIYSLGVKSRKVGEQIMNGAQLGEG